MASDDELDRIKQEIDDKATALEKVIEYDPVFAGNPGMAFVPDSCGRRFSAAAGRGPPSSAGSGTAGDVCPLYFGLCSDRALLHATAADLGGRSVAVRQEREEDRQVWTMLQVLRTI